MAKQASRAALIAGGSGAIGSAIGKRLASDGVKVFLGFHKNQEAGEAGVSEIAAAGGDAKAIHLDISSLSESEEVCQHIFNVCGNLDILVNCAALILRHCIRNRRHWMESRDRNKLNQPPVSPGRQSTCLNRWAELLISLPFHAVLVVAAR
jgi:NAD(P)-dependent dehydrogenase (short-subunit alcohol dehydrogenase family)